MSNHLELLRNAASNVYKYDLSDDTFERTSKVHDWRNYVPEVIQDIWKELNEKERLLVVVMAEEPANAEEWD